KDIYIITTTWENRPLDRMRFLDTAKEQLEDELERIKVEGEKEKSYFQSKYEEKLPDEMKRKDVPLSSHEGQIAFAKLQEELVEFFRQPINLTDDENNVMKVNVIADGVDEEESVKIFFEDRDIQKEILENIALPLPDRVLKIWAIADELKLTKEEVEELIVKVVEGADEHFTVVSSFREEPGIVEKNERLIRDFIENLQLHRHRTTGIRKLYQGSKSKKYYEAVRRLRQAALTKMDIEFLESFIERKGDEARFEEAFIYLSAQVASMKDPDENITSYLEKRTTRLSYRMDTIIAYHRDVSPQYELDATLREGNVPPAGDEEDLDRQIGLISYILGLDAYSVPAIFTDYLLERRAELVGRSSDRFRVSLDFLVYYRDMMPLDQNSRQVVRVSLTILATLYLFLNEHVRVLEAIDTYLENETGFDYQQEIVREKRHEARRFKRKIIRAFEEIYQEYVTHYEDEQFDTAIKLADKVFSQLEGAMYVEEYPTFIDRRFAQGFKEIVNRPKIQENFRRLNEIDFDSSHLISFMTPILSPAIRYSRLRFPYVHKYGDALGYGTTNNPSYEASSPWEGLVRDFQEKEGFDISEIQRVYPSEPMVIKRVTYGNTFDMMINELLKNCIAYAKMDEEKRTLSGVITEDFYEDEAGYVYTITDTNSGIPRDEVLPYVFNVAFSHWGSNRSFKKFAGYGLGLAYVCSILEMYDGSVRVISRRGEENDAYQIEYKDSEISQVTKCNNDDVHALPEGVTGTRVVIRIPYSRTPDLEEFLYGIASDDFGPHNELPLRKKKILPDESILKAA
ncbi:ATP-binding protein, partial [Candidatus Omnitrophota bacterium]